MAVDYHTCSPFYWHLVLNGPHYSGYKCWTEWVLFWWLAGYNLCICSLLCFLSISFFLSSFLLTSPLLSSPLLSSPRQCHQCQSYWILSVYNVIIRCENGDTMEQWGLGRHSLPLVPSHTLPVCYQDTHVHTHLVTCWKDVQHALELELSCTYNWIKIFSTEQGFKTNLAVHHMLFNY